MRPSSRRLIPCALAAVLLSVAPPVLATDHQNLEHGIPTSLEDIEPIERGTVEFQIFGRFLRLRGAQNVGETEPRLVWGAFDETQLLVATPLLLGLGAANGNGDVVLGALRKLWNDREDRWWPGAALILEVRVPTGIERAGFHNNVDVGLTAALKKDFGTHSFHLNLGHEWIGDQSDEEKLRTGAWSVVIGHDTPMTERFLLVTDVVWRQADARENADIWILESGIRVQVSRRLIGAVGIGVGLNRGRETPEVTATAGLQFGF